MTHDRETYLADAMLKGPIHAHGIVSSKFYEKPKKLRRRYRLPHPDRFIHLNQIFLIVRVAYPHQQSACHLKIPVLNFHEIRVFLV